MYTLSDGQPVQRVTKYGSDVLVESSASDEARSGVHCGLQTPNSGTRRWCWCVCVCVCAVWKPQITAGHVVLDGDSA